MPAVRQTHVGAVAGTDDQTAVEHKLHIGRARGFCSSSRYVLTNVTGWSDDLGLADIVILKEDDFEGVANVLVSVDNLADLVNQVNDLLMVSYSPLLRLKHYRHTVLAIQ